MYSSLFSLLFVYLTSGILIMKLKYKATGVQMLPNSALWTELPGNIKVFYN